MNQLANASSPYLRQHASNLIDWQPWSTEAFAQAASEQKLVLVSIGYSTCHWCHQMSHDVFEDPTVAGFQNRSYISIKVDREERPDIDQVYMDACRLLTGQGGWPLNVFCLPDGRPIHAVTYLPKDAWIQMLGQLHLMWIESPERVSQQAEKIAEAVRAQTIPEFAEAPAENGEVMTRSPESLLREAWSRLAPMVDTLYGGTKGAPKFPLPVQLESLSELSRIFPPSLAPDDPTWKRDLREHVHHSLNSLSLAGIFDHVGGGFFRYSTDDEWHIPHFEKMLYDNAQALSLFARAYATDPNPLWKRAMRHTVDWLYTALARNDGLWMSALDADSEHREGACYAWSQAQVLDVLQTSANAETFVHTFDISHKGNWENGVNVPRIPWKLIRSEDPALLSTTLDAMEPERKILLQARSEREQPSTDDKVILEWNALLVRGLLDAGRALDDAKLISTGLTTLDALLNTMKDEQGRHLRSITGKEKGHRAFLSDLVFLADACLVAYETTLATHWASACEQIVDEIMAVHADTKSVFFLMSPSDGETLFASRVELDDNVIPSANSVLARVLARIGEIADEPAWIERSRQMILGMREIALSEPAFHANWLRAFIQQASPFATVQISGPDAQRWAREVWRIFPLARISGECTAQGQTRAEICDHQQCFGTTHSLKTTLEQIGTICQQEP